MIVHTIGIMAVSAVLVLISLLPFLPGSYDPLAAPLSLMARVFGVLGLLLVPIGAVWFARPRYALAIVALVVSSLLWAAVSLVALMASGWLLGIVTLALLRSQETEGGIADGDADTGAVSSGAAGRIRQPARSVGLHQPSDGAVTAPGPDGELARIFRRVPDAAPALEVLLVRLTAGHLSGCRY